MRSTTLVKLIAPLALVAACSDSSGPAKRVVSLSFSSTASTALAAQAAQAPNFDVTVTVGANTIVITKAQIVLRKVELKQSEATACPDDEGEHEDCNEVKLGPMLVDLPLTAGASNGITASIPEGTYREIEFQIHRPTNRSGDAAFAAANPNFANASIRIEGTYNGSPFVFTSTMTQAIELKFEPPVAITADNQNVTINVDLTNWFKVNGVVINPTTANPGQPNEQAVNLNIRQSLKAFKDNDHNGRDD